MRTLSSYRLIAVILMLAFGGLAAPAVSTQAQSAPAPITFAGDQAAKFQRIQMVSATNGWAVVGVPNPRGNPDAQPGQLYTGTFAHILRTQDGGETWADVSPSLDFVLQLLPCDCSDNGLLAYAFLDDQHAWVVSDEYGSPYNPIFNGINVQYTSDGGASWQASFQILDAVSVIQMQFSDPQNGWLLLGATPAGMVYLEPPPALYRTVDGGQHWNLIADDGATSPYDGSSPISTPETGVGLAVHTAMGFDSLDSGWITWTQLDPHYGGLRHTEDGGATWHAVDIPGDTRLSTEYDDCLQEGTQALAPGSIIFIADCPGNGIRADRSWLYWTDDAGKTWQTSALPKLMLLYNNAAPVPQIIMLDAATGWMISVRAADRRLFVQRSRSAGCASIVKFRANVRRRRDVDDPRAFAA